MRKVVFDSPCRTHQAHLCVSSGASCHGWMNTFGWVHIFSGHSFIALPVMAGNCRCLLLLTLGHLAKMSLSLALLSGHADASQYAGYDLFFPLSPQVFCPLTAVSLSSPSFPVQLPAYFQSCSPATARSAVAAVPAIAPFRSEWAGHWVMELAQV